MGQFVNVIAQLVGLCALSALCLNLGFFAGQRVINVQTPGPLTQPQHKIVDNTTYFNSSYLTPAMVLNLTSALSNESSRSISDLLGPHGLENHKAGAAILEEAVVEALKQLATSFDEKRHGKLLRGFQLIRDTNVILHTALQAALPVARDRLKLEDEAAQTAIRNKLEAEVAQIPTSDNQGTKQQRKPNAWKLTVIMRKRPLGLRIRAGTTYVEEVFPGFPAATMGIQRGCELKKVDNKTIYSGTWLKVIERHRLPATLHFECKNDAKGVTALGPLNQAEHRYRVMVVEQPFGMNVQVNHVPRVVDVLPGYPAEAAGVKRGFVLTEVNDVKVNMDTWFKAYRKAQQTKLPFSLTFDTNVPLHKDNPYFEINDSPSNVTKGSFNLKKVVETVTEEPAVIGSAHNDFTCKVNELPFGMQVNATPGHMPTVIVVAPKSPAYQAGVRPQDVILQVAGRPVNSLTWFGAFQQAVPPFGLRLRRYQVNQ